jgi:hypothetical protein
MTKTRWLMVWSAVASLLSGCSGGSSSGSSTPPVVPTSTVSGTAMDAPLSNALVTFYDYSSGAVGATLATTYTDAHGVFTVNIQAESKPVLVIATGGTYTEEASGTTVTLAAGQSLRSVFNHVTGQNDVVRLTPYTHAAAALAAFKVKQGYSATQSVTDALAVVNQAVGFDINKILPLSISDGANATASPNESYFYGFLSAGISSLTAYASQKSGTTVHTVQNSIAFAQLMYADLVADGMLDGNGVDVNNNVSPLSLGTMPLSQTIYRYAVAAHVLKAVNSPYNKTALVETQLANYATQYAMTMAGVWGGAAPVGFSGYGRPTVSFTAPAAGAWIGGTAVVSGAAADNLGVDNTHLLVDGVDQGAAVNAGTPVFNVNTVALALGDGAHTLSLRTMNSIGIEKTVTLSSGVDNTPPTATGTTSAYFSTASNANRVYWSVKPQDAGAGIKAVWVTNPGSGISVPLVLQGDGSWYVDVLITALGPFTVTNTYGYPVTVQDGAVSCSKYNDNAGGVTGAGWQLLSSGPC